MFDQVSDNVQKQRDLGDCGGVEALLGICDPEHVATESRLLVPVLWSLRNSLHNNATNKDRLVRAGGMERLVQVSIPKHVNKLQNCNKHTSNSEQYFGVIGRNKDVPPYICSTGEII